jgi:hypothetical protein
VPRAFRSCRHPRQPRPDRRVGPGPKARVGREGGFRAKPSSRHRPCSLDDLCGGCPADPAAQDRLDEVLRQLAGFVDLGQQAPDEAHDRRSMEPSHPRNQRPVEEPTEVDPTLTDDFRKTIDDCANDLREIIGKLRRRLLN